MEGVVPANGVSHDKGGTHASRVDVKQQEPSSRRVVKFEEQSSSASILEQKSEDVKPYSTLTPKVDVSLLPDSPPPTYSPLKDEADNVDRDQQRSSSSRLQSPDDELIRSRRRGGAAARASPAGPTQSAKHLPLAYDRAIKLFDEIRSNSYQNNKVGRTRGHEKEAMTCECHYRKGIDDPMMACGEDAGCYNRSTQVECRAVDCNCGEDCQNLRFQKHQYANVEIVQTEKKGFGLRAGEDVQADQFIYEYVGEVVEQAEFMRRMEQYKNEGIRHYYFMMLQREEFLDATKRGGVARFINHSCNPNCYVSKWHVGKHMRMGIFSKRDIVKGEELTFNYNVDRYGNEAQTCYCGEPNCVGSIGGKTQTDIGGMDQLFLDALGIADEVDRTGARGSRRKKSRHLDEDFTPLLRPMEVDEVAKVITAVRQAALNRAVLHKLLMRIHMTRDTDVQRKLVQLHGFILMAGVLDEWRDDKDVVLLAMGSLARWPLIARNKVVDSGVDKLVKDLSTSSDEEIRSLACDLLAAWDALEMSYRIARREAGAGQHTITLEHKRADDMEDITPSVSLQDARAPNTVSNRLETIAPKPLVKARREFGAERSHAASRHSLGSHQGGDTSSFGAPPRYKHSHDTHRPSPLAGQEPVVARPAMSIEEIIRKANESEAAQRRQAEEAAVAAAKAAAKTSARSGTPDSSFGRNGSSLKRRSSHHSSSKSKEKRPKRDIALSDDDTSQDPFVQAADRRLKKLIGEAVVRCMSSFKDELDRDVFKKHAKELTTIVCNKEKRNAKVWPPSESRGAFMPEGLSTEKRGKIKALVLDYTRKLVDRKAKGGHLNGSAETPASTSHSHDTPREGAGLVSHAASESDEIGMQPDDSPTSGSATLSVRHNGHSVARTTASAASTNTSVDHIAPDTPHESVTGAIASKVQK